MRTVQRKFLQRVAILGFLALPIASCNSPTCNVIGSKVDPIELGEILAVGQVPSTGDVFVIDRTADSPFRVFRSKSGNLLNRMPLWEVTDIDSDAGRTVHMNLGDGIPLFYRMTIEVDGMGAVTALRLEDQSLTLLGMELPAGVSFVSRTRTLVIGAYGFVNRPHGPTVLLARPDVDWSNEEYRVFYGDPDFLIERKQGHADTVVGNAHASFIADGHSVEATFPSEIMGGAPGPIPTLQVDGQPPQDLSFLAPPYDRRHYSIACGQDDGRR